MNWFDTLKFDPYLRSKIKGGNKQQGLDDEEYVVIELDGGEEQVMDLWNKSNQGVPRRDTGERYTYDFEPRGDKQSTSKYPITRWFGVIHWQKIPKNDPLYEDSENGKRARLIALSGFGDGENGKFGYLGGTRVSEDYQKKGFGGKVKRRRDSINPHKIAISGYKQKGWEAFVSDGKVEIKQPETHSVIPKEVLDHFRESYGKKWTIFDPDWKEELKSK